MLRTRSRVTQAVIPPVATVLYKADTGYVTVNGIRYTVSVLPPVVKSSSSSTISLSTSDRQKLESAELIADESGRDVSRDKIKSVRHVLSEIDSIPLINGVASSASISTAPIIASIDNPPRGYYCNAKAETALPGIVMVLAGSSRQLVRVDRVGGTIANIVYTGTLNMVFEDRLGRVPAKLVAKLDSLHALNSAWEAREFPQLFDMFRKRNRLATREGLNWIATLVSNRKQWKAVRALTPKGYASKAFLDWLRNNQLGYSFGLAPTVGDVRQIAEALSKGLKPKRQRVTATIKQEKGQHRETDLSGFVSYPALQPRMVEKVVSSRVDGVRATLRRAAYYSDFFNNVLPALFGHNPMNMIWAAVPFSWCVDLLLNIDDVLDTLWCLKQTEYELEFWSSTKLEDRVSYESLIVKDFEGPTTLPVLNVTEPMPTIIQRHSAYKRDPRLPPTASNSVRASVGPMMGYLTALVALGFLPKGKKIGR